MNEFINYFDRHQSLGQPTGKDYIQDGIIYCGNCKTPKQCRIGLLGREFIMPVVCDCKRADIAREETRRAAAKTADRIKQLRAGLAGAKYLGMTFDASNAPIKFAQNYVDRWAEMYRRNLGLMIIGANGQGKTYAAACIANALVDKGISVYMDNIVAMCGKLSSMYDNDRQSYIERLQDCSLLVIDDIGAERKTDTAVEQAYNIVESRYRSAKPLIVTSNLSRAELMQCSDLRYTRIYDRLKEMCHPIEMHGPSRRVSAANSRIAEIDALLNADYSPSYDINAIDQAARKGELI